MISSEDLNGCLPLCNGISLIEKSTENLPQDFSTPDVVRPEDLVLPEILPPSPACDFSVYNAVDLPVSDTVSYLPRELFVYGPGEFVSQEAKQQAQNHQYKNIGLPKKMNNGSVPLVQNDRQRLIRHTEELLVNRYPLRAFGEQLYLCEDCIWKAVSINRLWRYLRTSDLNMSLDIESFTDHDIKELYHRLLTNSAIQLDGEQGPPLDSEKAIINLQDFCFNVNTMKCCAQDPEYFFTSKLNIWRNELEENEAEHFEAFVQTSLEGNISLRQLLLEILGTLLSNYRPKNIFVFCGASNSGKSVIVDFLRWVLGVSAITQVAHLRDFSSRWTIGNLKGKKLLVCTECADEAIGAEALFVAAIALIWFCSNRSKRSPILFIVSVIKESCKLILSSVDILCASLIFAAFIP